MLAGARSRFLLFFLLTFSIGISLPIRAQINGAPASVTSMGFGGRFTNGVAPSVTSLGANGNVKNSTAFANCCANFFLPENANPTLFPMHHRRHKGKDDKDHANFPIGILEPAYIPYPVPYAEEADDDSSDADYGQGPVQRNLVPSAKHAVGRDSTSKADASARSAPDEQAPIEPEEPVAAQPSTVLVFKDGHKSDVLNYAIVGDTLFDFAEGRSRKILLADLDLPATRKANDDRGVDFQIPANASRQQ